MSNNHFSGFANTISKKGFTVNNINQQQALSDLLEFLRMPLDSTNAIFTKFASIAGAIEYRSTTNSKQRFVYIQGTRSDRVVLVAHADTVRDEEYGNIKNNYPKLSIDNGIVTNTRGDILGADDRAGCAILWQLRQLGHSLLIIDGEEQSCIGSKWLKAEFPHIAKELNQHQFMLQFDRCNGNDFKCYEVGNDAFRKYIQKQTNYSEPDRFAYTDICILCEKICGANLSIGYYLEHTRNEYLVLDEWLQTLLLMQQMLSAKLPRFEL